MNYYNEHDPFAAEWLRQLIEKKLIPDGHVDDRDLQKVTANDIKGYTQCHFFAGIGGWSRALDLAGWPSDRPVWTGSTPCQPFSNAGQRRGLDDERHLWPHFYDLIRELRPPTIFGEQVAGAIGKGWWDALQGDMAAEDYATGMVVLPACSVGAPHHRQRLFFVSDRVGNSGSTGLPMRERQALERARWREEGRAVVQSGSAPDRLADDDRTGRELERPTEVQQGYPQGVHHSDGCGQTHGFWADADWLGCRDGKWRPVEPGTSPLVDGISGRVGRLRGYGNAIVPQVAAEVIMAYMEGEQ